MRKKSTKALALLMAAIMAFPGNTITLSAEEGSYLAWEETAVNEADLAGEELQEELVQELDAEQYPISVQTVPSEEAEWITEDPDDLADLIFDPNADLDSGNDEIETAAAVDFYDDVQ